MRRAAWKAALAAALAWAGADGAGPSSRWLTIVVDADRPLPGAAANTMRDEMDRLYAGSGMRFRWVERKAAGPDFEAESIVVVKLRGECRVPDEPVDPPPASTLAATHVSDGVILPFTVVDCETLTRMVRSDLRGPEMLMSGQILGRALARVVAHELVHILLQRREHASKGIFRQGLTARELVEEFADDEEAGRILLEDEALQSR